MLNLRLAQPSLLIDITRIPELAQISDGPEEIEIGAIVTHAVIEDGKLNGPTGRFLSDVARGIAYRAVRTRGTIGGSLAHADPAADWLSCLTALGAELLIASDSGTRRQPIAGFVEAAMQTVLGSAELVTGIRVPKLSPAARFGFAKITRKTGEFAEAIGVVVDDRERRLTRLVAATPAGAPIVIEDFDINNGLPPNAETLRQRLVQAGFPGDVYEKRLATAALQRAIAKARSQ
jgi:carbon-monoxide dehydrogenase medium subunit